MSYCASRQSVSGRPFRAFSSLDGTFHWCWAMSWPFFVVVEAGDAVAVGGADEVAVRVVLVSGFLNLVVIAGEGVD